MKRIFAFLAAGLITSTLWAQSPEKISYQAVIRDSNNDLVVNTIIGMQISILQGSTTGMPVYVERQFPATNADGLVSIEIGSSEVTVISGDFSNINWSADSYFIKTETDINGGSNYTISGTSQLVSVPYALHAKTAESVTGEITETDPVFNSWDKSTGVTVTESQISDLKSYLTSYVETDPVYNTSQASNITATDITNLGNLYGTNTGDQTISRTGTTVTLSNNGGSYTDSVNTYTAGTGISISGNIISATNSIALYTSAEIASLSPSAGDPVYNITEGLYQIYDGSNWMSIPASCWPNPTTANAGVDQAFTDTTTTVTLAANTPEAGHGAGTWTIVSGTGGSFTDASSPTTTFTGTACTNYTLRWTISTLCDSSSDDVAISFNQALTKANAGNDQAFTDAETTVTLSANKPESGHGKGAWKIVSGTEGSLADASNPTTTFKGTPGNSYTLRWTISTACDNSSDDVRIRYLASNDVYNPTTGKVWMDRNLGATQVATSSTDANAYGDLYQWGRSADGHENRKSGTTTTLSSSDTPGHSDFINNASSPFDWRSPQNDNLWQGVNGVNNPCPSGYRLPTLPEWEAERSSWDYATRNAAGALASPLKLPMAGRRDFADGSLTNVGSWGGYWSSTVNGTQSWHLYFFTSYNGSGTNDFYRAYGLSVRCIKD